VRRIFGSIRFKIVSVILLVLAGSIGFSLFFMIGTIRNNLLGSVRSNLAVNNEILNTVIRNLMLEGEAAIAVQTLEGLKSLEQFKEIAIYRIDGTTAFNDFETIDSVNKYQTERIFAKTDRSKRLILENPNFKKVLETNTPRQEELVSERKMEYFFPILNYAQCRECHGQSSFIRGVAYYQVSTAAAYDRINASGFFLSSFLAIMGLSIGALLIVLMQRIVVAPVLLIGSTVEKVGSGNLDVAIELESRDELGRLAFKINEMIDGLKTRNRLMIENKTIEARNQENRKYLDNIGQGLLLIGEDYTIREQYSSFLLRLFGEVEPAGKRFVDFIYPNPKMIGEQKELEKFLSLVFHNTLTEMDMIQAANPLLDKVLRVSDGRGGEKEIIVDVGFARIMDADRVESVMAIFEDRTQIALARKELAVQRERRDAELEEISAILNAGPEAFSDFTKEANSSLELLRQHSTKLADHELISSLFRVFHSLKGSARYLDLRSFERRAHELEDILASIRDGADPKLKRNELENAAARLEEETENIQSINERFRSFVPESKAQTSNVKTDAMLSRLASMAKSIAEDLGKQVHVETINEIGTLPHLMEIKNSLVHIVRNAVDHGLEEGLERLASGKAEEGHLVIRFFSPASGEVAIEVADDGKGIDFDAIRRKAESRGLLKPGRSADQHQLLQYIFMPNFTSKESVSGTSGRGVGLDVVAAAVKALGGKISLKTGKNEGSRFTIRYPNKKETI